MERRTSEEGVEVTGHGRSEDFDLERITYRAGDHVVEDVHGTWYRGPDCNFIATKADLAKSDAIDRYILNGWTPAAPFVDKQTVITAFGSCFAQEISRYLGRRGYRVTAEELSVRSSHVVRFGSGIVNSFAIRQQFEWAYERRAFDEDLWYGAKGELAGYDEEIRAETQEIFDQTDLFVITLGLSEVWCNRETGEVFWRAIPADRFDPEVHGFRVSTVEENLANLERVYALIRANRPEARVLFTLSPVPLVATFRPVSCLTANSVSKAILRVAVDELMRAHPDDAGLFYFPSYEIVKEFVADPYRDDNRHIKHEVVEQIMHTFERHYCVEGA